MTEKYLDTIDKEILRLLYIKGRPMTIGEISSETNISWVTVKKHLEKLDYLKITKKVILKKRKLPKVILDFSIIEKISKRLDKGEKYGNRNNKKR